MIILQRTEHWLWPTQQAIRTNWYHHLNQASSPRSFHVDHQTKIEKPLSSDQKLGIPPPKKKGPKCFSGLFSRNKRGGGTDTSSHHQYRNVRARAPPASHRTDLVRESIPPSQKKWGAGGGGKLVMERRCRKLFDYIFLPRWMKGGINLLAQAVFFSCTDVLTFNFN